LLIIRATVGSLLAGHGTQKLFGWFNGPGFEGFSGWMESMNLRPGRFWAAMAGMSEFLGGLLMVLGLLNPIGPLIAMGSMLMAWMRVHRGKPIWVTEGGAELPATYLAVQTALVVAGPGRLSLDHLFGVHLPRWLAIPGIAALAAAVLWSDRISEALQPVVEEITGPVQAPQPQQPSQQEQAPREAPTPAAPIQAGEAGREEETLAPGPSIAAFGDQSSDAGGA
jgi:putative oxidoreductase